MQDFLSGGMGEVQDMHNIEEGTVLENNRIESNAGLPDEMILFINMSQYLLCAIA